MTFSKRLFWDVDPETFDPERGRRLVVQRVLTRGTLEDLRKLMVRYPRSVLRETVLGIRDWEPKVRNFISIWLDIPKEEFACCTSRLSHPRHWD